MNPRLKRLLIFVTVATIFSFVATFAMTFAVYFGIGLAFHRALGSEMYIGGSLGAELRSAGTITLYFAPAMTAAECLGELNRSLKRRERRRA